MTDNYTRYNKLHKYFGKKSSFYDKTVDYLNQIEDKTELICEIQKITALLKGKSIELAKSDLEFEDLFSFARVCLFPEVYEILIDKKDPEVNTFIWKNCLSDLNVNGLNKLFDYLEENDLLDKNPVETFVPVVNLSFSPKLLNYFSKHSDDKMRVLLAKSLDCKNVAIPTILEDLLHDKSLEVRKEILNNPTMTQYILDQH